MMARLPRIFGMLAAAILLAGCSHPESLTVAPAPTLPPPSPIGMEQMPAEPPLPPGSSKQDCDPTASLRPFPTKAEADDANVSKTRFIAASSLIRAEASELGRPVMIAAPRSAANS